MEHQLITPGAELQEARRDTYTDYKLRQEAGHPDGRPASRLGKGARPKGEGKDEPRRQGGKKGGKGQNYKGDQKRRQKDEAAKGDK